VCDTWPGYARRVAIVVERDRPPQPAGGWTLSGLQHPGTVRTAGGRIARTPEELTVFEVIHRPPGPTRPIAYEVPVWSNTVHQTRTRNRQPKTFPHFLIS
jgi:hypothetical protein